jgi:preprotein translocase subunit SecY
LRNPWDGGGIVSILVFLSIGLLTILAMVFIYQGQRRVPLQHSTKRMVGRDGRAMLVGSTQTTYIPMQVNSSGMIPVLATWYIRSQSRWINS